MAAKETQISVYPVIVDYSKRIKTLIWLGKYDRYDDTIVHKKIKPACRGKVGLEAVLVYFDYAVTDEDIITELKIMGLRPGELRELLAFGAQHPEIQCQFPIIALGTIVQLDTVRGAPRLSGSKCAGRQLDFTYCGGKWGGGHRFLAVRISIDI